LDLDYHHLVDSAYLAFGALDQQMDFAHPYYRPYHSLQIIRKLNIKIRINKYLIYRPKPPKFRPFLF
jgi:hypothetical protein